ncbi:MAG: hypothetical protein ABIR84_14050 [Candidatus Nitrotoga sp.]
MRLANQAIYSDELQTCLDHDNGIKITFRHGINSGEKWRLSFALWPSGIERTALASWQPLVRMRSVIDE